MICNKRQSLFIKKREAILIEKMMKKILTVILMMQNLLLTAQNKNIKLPKGYGFEVKYSDTSITPIFSVHVTKKGKVSFEDIKLPVEKLGDTIFKYRNKIRPDLMPFIINHIYADKKTPYKYVDAVKEQMSRARMFRVIYRTDNTQDISKGLTYSVHRYLKPAIKEPGEEKSLIFGEIPIVRSLEDQIIENLYTLQFEQAKLKLNKFKYVVITINDSESLLVNNKKILLKEAEQIYDAMKNNDFFIISVDENLKYEDYIKNLTTIVKSYKKYEKHISLFEISIGLQKILKEKNIKL